MYIHIFIYQFSDEASVYETYSTVQVHRGELIYRNMDLKIIQKYKHIFFSVMLVL